MKSPSTNNLILDAFDDLRALREGDSSHIRIRFDAATQNRIAAATYGQEGRTVLLLGGTGFVGIYLLHALLEDERIERVYAIVRASDQASGERRPTRRPAPRATSSAW